MKQETKHSHVAAGTPASGHRFTPRPETTVSWDFLSLSRLQVLNLGAHPKWDMIISKGTKAFCLELVQPTKLHSYMK